MQKITSIAQAVDQIKDGMSIMVGGFLGCGSAHQVLEELSKRDVKNLTVMCNDGGLIGGPNGDDYYGVAKLIHTKQVKKLYATHVGLNAEIGEQMMEGTLEVVLVPQGSFAEMIRAGGAGLGGVLTPTGVGTIIQDAEHVHSVIEIEGKKYLLEKPLKADVAIIYGSKIDEAGNMCYTGSTRNFNEFMAMAADLVIAEAEEIVPVGAISPDDVVTPGILVDHIVKGGPVRG